MNPELPNPNKVQNQSQASVSNTKTRHHGLRYWVGVWMLRITLIFFLIAVLIQIAGTLDTRITDQINNHPAAPYAFLGLVIWLVLTTILLVINRLLDNHAKN